MIHLRKANDRGHANHGWLASGLPGAYLSFADYYDPNLYGSRRRA